MSRKSTKRNTMPYFYIIRHKETGRLYAGSKTSKVNAFPDLFMKPNGYTTSSKIVNSIIEKEGLDAFEVVELIEQKDCSIPVYDYETNFLVEVNATYDPMWLNCHNNDGLNFANPEQMKLVIEQYEERTGYKTPMRDPEIIERRNQLFLERYGVENPAKNEEVRLKMESTCEQRHGYKNPFYDEQKQKEMQEANLKVVREKYGTNSTLAVPEIREKATQTLLEKYGVDNAAKSPELVQKAQNKREDTFKEKYGMDVASAGSLPWVAEKIKNTINSNKIECPHCGKIVPRGNSYHFDNCRSHSNPEIRHKNQEMAKERAIKMIESRNKKGNQT